VSGVVVAVTGEQDLRRNMARILDATTGPKVQAVNLQAARLMRNEAKRLAPELKKYKKGAIPGLLRASIYATLSRAPGDLDAIVSVNTHQAFYAVWLEYGNSRIPAQPYMRPAFAATRDEMVATMIAGYSQIIQGAI
jgi:HK97 gp10 family phage protein